MGLPADRVAFVGHDAEELAGAARVGLATIAFNYDPDARADVFITRFRQLLSLVSLRSPQAGRG
jgi:FMN phosphatase YigB (HAD superfamily)